MSEPLNAPALASRPAEAVRTSLRVTVVVVTWNALRYVDECLTSLALQELAVGDRLEVIMVDNASSDGTLQHVRNHHPAVTVIGNADNRGFAAGNNIGLRLAMGQYVCLINSDVNVPPGCLSQLVAFMDQHTDVGLLGPAMVGPDGRVQRSTMRIPTVWSALCHALTLDTLLSRLGLWGGYLMKDFGHDTTRDVDVLNGWFWVARRDAIDDVGPLDERFFMYAEDIDWCYRFARAGWRVVFTAEQSALHYGAGSSSRQPIRFYLEMQRANLMFWAKHNGAISTLAYRATLLVHHAIRVAGFACVYGASPTRRAEAAFKMRRSMSAARWLLRGNLSSAVVTD